MQDMALDSIRHEQPLTTLVELAAMGDREAFERLMTLTQPRVMAMTWRMLGNEPDAKDAAQEIYIRLYRNLALFDREHELFAWLYRIAVNVCRDIGRDRRRRQERFSSLDAVSEPRETAVAAGQENAVARREEREAVARAIATLPEKERAAIVLRDVEGLDTDEVARILQSSATTVRSQIHSARKKLRALLGGSR